MISMFGFPEVDRSKPCAVHSVATIEQASQFVTYLKRTCYITAVSISPSPHEKRVDEQERNPITTQWQ